jgi:hypothetical protein
MISRGVYRLPSCTHTNPAPIEAVSSHTDCQISIHAPDGST